MGVVMVWRAAHDGVDILLLETLSPIDVRLRAGKRLQRIGETELVHIAQRDDVLLFKDVVVRQAPAPDADKCDVKFAAGPALPKQRATLQDQKPRTSRGGRL